MINNIVRKKRKAFTLIEMVAVVAIIGILAAILVPKITGYMKEAKKTGVVDQARKVVQAYETAVMKEKTPSANTGLKVKDIVTASPTMASLLDHPTSAITATLDKLPGGMTVLQCKDIVENKAEFTVSSEGELEKIGDTTVASQ